MLSDNTTSPVLELTWFSARPLLSGTNSVDGTVRLLSRFTNCLPDSNASE